LLKEKVPLKIVVPVIVVTWILSLVSSVAIMYVMPSLIPLRSEQVKDAIPYGVISTNQTHSTSSTSFVDMPEMSVTISTSGTSRLIIVFSGHTWLSGSGKYLIIAVRAMVDTAQAYPQAQNIWFGSGAHLGILLGEVVYPDYSSHSFTFHSDPLDPGTHTVKIQWRVYASSNAGHIASRSLTVIALPA
jgi:hypothetical protein